MEYKEEGMTCKLKFRHFGCWKSFLLPKGEKPEPPDPPVVCKQGKFSLGMKLEEQSIDTGMMMVAATNYYS